MHSIYSDGKDTVPKLLNKIREAGIRTFALSDHDTVDGALEMKDLVPEDMRFIPSIEFSCKYKEEREGDKWSCHILGYGADPEKKAFSDIVHEAKEIRLQKMNWRFGALEAIHHIQFTQEQKDWINGHSSPGKPHLAQVLTQMLYESRKWPLPDSKSPDSEWERYRSCFQQEIQEKLNTLGRKCRENGLAGCEAHLEPRKTIEGILKGGGVPVWAHPFGENRGKFISEEEVRIRLEKLKSMGLMGMECYYSQYNEQEVAFLLALAREYHLLVSGGSDYHSLSVKPNRLGELNTYGEPVTEEMLSLLHGLP